MHKCMMNIVSEYLKKKTENLLIRLETRNATQLAPSQQSTDENVIQSSQENRELTDSSQFSWIEECEFMIPRQF